MHVNVFLYLLLVSLLAVVLLCSIHFLTAKFCAVVLRSVLVMFLSLVRSLSMSLLFVVDWYCVLLQREIAETQNLEFSTRELQQWNATSKANPAMSTRPWTFAKPETPQTI